jgi:hypothetical protein
MVNSYELSRLDPYAFENLVNLLALKVLGAGSSGFGPGADGGRDGIFQGEALYPSSSERWKGMWYIQSKFHSPHLSTDPHKWLIEKVRVEIESFNNSNGDRVWPNNWIIATNIDPSGKPNTGSYDAIVKMVSSAASGVNFSIWGGAKILGFLGNYPDIARQYAHFITPGQIIAQLYSNLLDQSASLETVIRYLIATQFSEQIYTKLDQAGSSADTRPGVHHLFIDLPFSVEGKELEGMALDHLCRAAAQPQRHSIVSKHSSVWRDWNKNPQNARVALLKGGPGQGKSTVGQYFSQIQRAALLLSDNAPFVVEKVKRFALEVQVEAKKIGAWPAAPRIPIFIELKEYAHWFGQKNDNEARGVLSYLANRISVKVDQTVLSSTLRKAIAIQSWFVLFDGLDEVPNDVKDLVADEVTNFVNETLIHDDSDVLVLCTSRPQGYSGQFSALDGPVLNLKKLELDTAIKCAAPVVRYDRSEDEGTRSLELLTSAAASQSVRQLMTTPLQAHIMAVVVRDGGRPPELRWALFENFYQIMKKRESLKNVHNARISKLLREDDRLLRTVHTRLGFVLHARAERSDGAQTTLSKDEFRILVTQVVEKLSDENTKNTVDVVMEAMTERLVLVSTPENGEHVRFDIRQLQEFFAAEFLYDAVSPEVLESRVETVGGDSHWLEVMHFLLSALVENRRTTELSVVLKVLERLNEGGQDGEGRIFYRKMARGTVLGIRLLIEGVLEQDKRDRLKFKSLFEPVGGLIDVDLFSALKNVRAPNSKAWLISILYEKVAEANFFESIGAIILLGWLLPDEHPLFLKLVQKFRGLPASYQREALNAWSVPDYGKYRSKYAQHLSLWVVVSILSIANSESDWDGLSLEGKTELTSILKEQFEKIPAAAEKIGLDEKLAKLIHAVFEESADEDENLFPPEHFGIVKASRLKHNLITGSLPLKVESVWIDDEAYDSAGVIKLIISIIRFSRNINFDNFKDVLILIPVENDRLLSAVPDWLIGLFPCRGAHFYYPYDCSHLRSLDSVSFDDFFNLENLKKWPAFVIGGIFIQGASGNDREGWLKLFEHFPFIALSLLFPNNGVESFGVTKEQNEENLKLIENALTSSSRFAKMYFLHWGKFYVENIDIFNKLKNLTLVAQSRPDDEVFGVDELIPFPLNEDEDELVCLLAKGVTSFQISQSDGDWAERKRKLSTCLNGFQLSRDKLQKMINNHKYSADYRASAQLLYIVCGDPHEFRRRLLVAISNISEIKNFVNSTTSTWYVNGLCELMINEINENSEGAISLVTELLLIAREKIEIRYAIAKVLGVWREVSYSPVQKSNSLQKWLDE